MLFRYFESPFCFLLFVKLVHQVYLSLSLTQEVLTSGLLYPHVHLFLLFVKLVRPVHLALSGIQVLVNLDLL